MLMTFNKLHLYLVTIIMLSLSYFNSY